MSGYVSSSRNYSNKSQPLSTATSPERASLAPGSNGHPTRTNRANCAANQLICLSINSIQKHTPILTDSSLGQRENHTRHTLFRVYPRDGGIALHQTQGEHYHGPSWRTRHGVVRGKGTFSLILRHRAWIIKQCNTPNSVFLARCASMPWSLVNIRMAPRISEKSPLGLTSGPLWSHAVAASWKSTILVGGRGAFIYFDPSRRIRESCILVYERVWLA